MNNILCIYRHQRFSPNSVERDAAILEAVGRRLCDRRCQVKFVHEDGLDEFTLFSLLRKSDFCFSMARSPLVVDALKRSGVPTVNTPESVELCCCRPLIDAMMRANNIPTAPLEGTEGYWMKRGDGPVQTRDDVVYCPDEAALGEARAAFHRRNIQDVVVSAHVVGDVIKFYGVCGTGFFRFFYPAETGVSKFGEMLHNHPPQHYAFSPQSLHEAVERMARCADVSVYGGDCVVRADGSFAIIDFNDWPSFACCREEAAETISSLYPY